MDKKKNVIDWDTHGGILCNVLFLYTPDRTRSCLIDF